MIENKKTSQEIIEEVATEWLRAFNEHNIENLLNLYDKDAVHFSPRLLALKPDTLGKIQGRDAMKEWWSDAFKRLPSLHYEKTNFEIKGDEIVITYKRQVEQEDDSVVRETLKIRDGKIIESRVLSI